MITKDEFENAYLNKWPGTDAVICIRCGHRTISCFCTQPDTCICRTDDELIDHVKRDVLEWNAMIDAHRIGENYPRPYKPHRAWRDILLKSLQALRSGRSNTPPTLALVYCGEARSEVEAARSGDLMMFRRNFQACMGSRFATLPDGLSGYYTEDGKLCAGHRMLIQMQVPWVVSMLDHSATPTTAVSVELSCPVRQRRRRINSSVVLD